MKIINWKIKAKIYLKTTPGSPAINYFFSITPFLLLYGSIISIIVLLYYFIF